MKNLLSVFVVLVSITAVCSSCSTTASDENEPETLSLDFSSQLIKPGPISEPYFTAAGGKGKIFTHGNITTSSPCHKISGRVEHVEREITLWVETNATGAICIGILGTFTYDATLSDLLSGPYLLRIKHAIIGSNDFNLVFEKSINVK